ncbi:MAG: hypothetical protein WEB06_19045 [Actinomycetota bacterium]
MVLRDACGLVLAERVVAAIDVPRFANSAMDGYAIVSADTAEASSDRPGRPVPRRVGLRWPPPLRMTWRHSAVMAARRAEGRDLRVRS